MRAAQQRPPHSRPPVTGSPLRGVSKRAQQGQSAGCSGQDLFTSNHESMQLKGETARGGASLAEQLLLRAGSPSRIPTSHPRGPDTHCYWREGAGHSGGCWLSRKTRAIRWGGVGLGPQEEGRAA